jgi:transposase-like protein
MRPVSYARHQFPPVLIQHAIGLSLRFTLSYRDVEDLLTGRGVEVSKLLKKQGFAPALVVTGALASRP